MIFNQRYFINIVYDMGRIYYKSALKIDGTIIATGCFVDNHITRVYVLPEHQKKGYGTFIMKNIEEQISEKYDKAYLDASLPAAALYEKLGFATVKHERYPVENGVILAYEVMEKELHKISTDINYDGRKFITKMNSENGEVGEQTNFTYHQNGNLLWAEYSGGDILKGSLIGTVLCNGKLDFVYHHMNQNMEIKTGKCHSVPTVQENGKIELSEKWQWTSGDYVTIFNIFCYGILAMMLAEKTNYFLWIILRIYCFYCILHHIVHSL